MVLSSKKKAHRSCSCSQCTRGKATESGQMTQKYNERKLRHMANQELRMAVLEAVRELEEIDILGKINSPYTD